MSLAIFSCNKTDDPTPAYVVPYTEQYPVDLAAIDKYLDEYDMDVSTDYDVTFKKITTDTPGIPIRTQYASDLHIKIVNRDGIDYKIYYISLREGLKDRPTRVDSAFVSYKGNLLNNTVFDQAQNPVWFPLENVVQGWKEIIPLFKTGDHVVDPISGSVTYTDFGAGVMFLPSAFGYYNGSVTGISSYSPLVFSFKLKKLNYVDHDYDRIDSKDEAFDLGTGTYNFSKDTDGDSRPDYLDQDDDGDGYLTKFEIKRPNIIVGGNSVSNGYYLFNGAAVDDPLTIAIDERQGIPDCSSTPDYTTNTRIRKHLNSGCHN